MKKSQDVLPSVEAIATFCRTAVSAQIPQHRPVGLPGMLIRFFNAEKKLVIELEAPVYQRMNMDEMRHLLKSIASGLRYYTNVDHITITRTHPLKPDQKQIVAGYKRDLFWSHGRDIHVG